MNELTKKKRNWEIEPLLEVSTIVPSGVKKFNGKKKYVETGDVLDNEIVSYIEYTFENRPSRANMEVERDDVLFAKMKKTSKILAIGEKEKNYLFSTGFAALRSNQHKILPRYLMHYLNSSTFQNMKDKHAHGGTQKAINQESMSKITLPLPNLIIQKKIVDVLDCIERIEKNRKLSKELATMVSKSYFSHLYGDPIKNTQKWEYATIDEISDTIYRYPSFYGIKYEDEGIPLIKIGNIKADGKLQEDYSSYNFITSEINNKFPRTILKYYDLLMAVRGDGSTGKIGYVSSRKFEGANISPNLLRISIKRNLCNPFFLFFLLRSSYGQALIRSKITRTAKKTITSTEIKKITFPLPPIEIQNKFVDFVTAVDELQEKQSNYGFYSNQLLMGLVEKAFNGKLLN